MIEDEALVESTRLRTVGVSHNRLRQLPHSIPATLREFLADDNAILGVFPSNFARGAELSRLSLQRNKIGALAANTFLPAGNLTKLNLAWNNITVLERLSFAGLNYVNQLRCVVCVLCLYVLCVCVYVCVC
ncbi:hypothetical protein EGW08_011260 [Elysia chlorotica]|uniref:LRRNT domain-containing protein n=1 Tax=Elysia chlorotica TaxID=188477 RepID=A0A433THC7_ELYCH|nr:hypothetical protein EGW08_011260 [Elysia chlorotica]